MDLENPPEPATIKEDHAMVKDDLFEKTPEPAATKDVQAKDPDPSLRIGEAGRIENWKVLLVIKVESFGLCCD